jgi:multidrug efflux pump subunit AcrB
MSQQSRNPFESLITWFAGNSVAANLLMFILLVGGAYSVWTIKKEIQPRVETNFINVSVPFLGATPLDVEEGVIIKVEEAIQDIEGIEEIVSTASRGMGSIDIEVNADYEVTDIMDQVKNRVDAISTFPDNTEKPIISRTTFQQQVVMVSVYGNVDEQTLKEYTKQVRNEIVTLPGVTRAEIIGSRDYEISIEISEFDLQSYGITLSEVAQAVRRGSLDLPAGSIRSAKSAIAL